MKFSNKLEKKPRTLKSKIRVRKSRATRPVENKNQHSFRNRGIIGGGDQLNLKRFGHYVHRTYTYNTLGYVINFTFIVRVTCRCTILIAFRVKRTTKLQCAYRYTYYYYVIIRSNMQTYMVNDLW